MKSRFVGFSGFLDRWSLDGSALKPVHRKYPFLLSNHFANLIREEGDGIWKQVVPDPFECVDDHGLRDPLGEEKLSPVPNLVHRYGNRVLWLVTNACALHCRFCTRKRRWGTDETLTEEEEKAALDYIRKHPEIRDVLLSGGDPLMLPTGRIEGLLSALRSIPHVEIVRIHTRVPSAAPGIVTARLARALAKHHPVYMNVHFNHPAELTPEASRACALLADSGIPLGSQTVLLNGVNDDPETLAALFQGLLRFRVRPYYLMQMDLVRGTEHFRTPVATGLRILRALRNRISGLAMPHFVIDLPGGKGKVPLVHNCVRDVSEGRLVLVNHHGETGEYPLAPGEAEDLEREMTRAGTSGLVSAPVVETAAGRNPLRVFGVKRPALEEREPRLGGVQVK